MKISSTTKYMLTACLLSFIALLPMYQYIYSSAPDWFNSFPFRIMGITTSYMAIFFHEIGHTVFSWIYGYPTLPMFDFSYGGGFSYSPMGQKYFIMGIANIGIIYAIYLFRDYRLIQIILGSILIFHLITGITGFHRNIIDFMGPLSEPLIASFFLTRALLNTAPKQPTERFLNAFFGFAFIFQSLLQGIALIGNDIYRKVYFEQKGSHGFGDLDKISERISFLSFNGTVMILIFSTIICLTIPFIIHWQKNMK